MGTQPTTEPELGSLVDCQACPNGYYRLEGSDELTIVTNYTMDDTTEIKEDTKVWVCGNCGDVQASVDLATLRPPLVASHVRCY
jgi:hypothetical protein